MINCLYSTKAGYTFGGMNVQAKPPEQNSGKTTCPPGYQLVQRVTTFDLDREITGGTGVWVK